MGIRNTRPSNLNTGQKISDASSYGRAPPCQEDNPKQRQKLTLLSNHPVSQSVNQSVIKQYRGKKNRQNFNQVADCLFIPSYQWQSFILGQNTATHISDGGSRSKEGSWQRVSLVSIRLYACMTYNHRGRFISFSLGGVVLSDAFSQENLIHLLSKWKYGLSKPVCFHNVF